MITPQTESKELAQKLGIPALFFKREDLHPYGSHKGRSIPRMIDEKVKTGAQHFAISSSGNAALAAICHVQNKNKEGGNFYLTVITGKNINPEKKKTLESKISDNKVKLVESERPLQKLLELVKGEHVVSLRQSNDPDALLGYESLAKEICEVPNISAVFLGASSGTTAQALAEYFSKHKPGLAVFIVQTSENSNLVDKYQKEKLTKERSLADAIIDKIGYRRELLQEILEKIGGSGFVVTNDEIEKSRILLKEKSGIDASPNGVLGFTGLLKAIGKGFRSSGAVMCIITGK